MTTRIDSENSKHCAITAAPPEEAVVALPQDIVSPPLLSTKQAATPSDSRVSTGNVYLEATRAKTAKWLDLLDPALPWGRGGWGPFARSSMSKTTLHQEAALALAAFSEHDRQCEEHPYIREAVRCSLIHWQLGLNGEGLPVRWRSRRDPDHIRAMYHVLLLLSETSGFDTTTLYDDLGRHIRWLARRPAGSPLVEAQLICAMADAAVLLGSTHQRDRVQMRLRSLLDRQNEEGWFDDRKGLDIGVQSLILDPMARLYRLHEWRELEEPIKRLLRFLGHFVHPDGQVGGCYNPLGCVRLSPYGLELLAAPLQEARGLTAVSRRQWADSMGWDAPPVREAPLAASAGLASALRMVDLESDATLPCHTEGSATFRVAGMTTHSTPAYYAVVNHLHGGAIHVTWRNREPDLVDSGVTVVFPLRVVTRAASSALAVCSSGGDSITVQGILRRESHRTNRRWSSVLNAFRRFLSPSKDISASKALSEPQRKSRGKPIARDRFRRTITFANAWLEICDEVECRLRCRAVMCQTPQRNRSPEQKTVTDANWCGRAPIIVEGGRSVQIRRVYHNGTLLASGSAIPSAE